MRESGPAAHNCIYPRHRVRTHKGGREGFSTNSKFQFQTCLWETLNIGFGSIGLWETLNIGSKSIALWGALNIGFEPLGLWETMNMGFEFLLCSSGRIIMWL